MDKRRVVLTTLQQCLRRLQAIERTYCDWGPRPIPDFPCLMPLITEAQDVIQLVARRRALVPRRR